MPISQIMAITLIILVIYSLLGAFFHSCAYDKGPLAVTKMPENFPRNRLRALMYLISIGPFFSFIVVLISFVKWIKAEHE